MSARLTTAVHALCWIELARRRGRTPLTSAEVAASLLSNPVLVRRVLGPLRDGGLLGVTGRGPGTGWRLARPAEEVTVADVARLLDEGSLFELHPHDPKDDCPVGHGIRPVLAGLYAAADRAALDALGRHTIAALLDTILRDHPLPAGPAA